MSRFLPLGLAVAQAACNYQPGSLLVQSPGDARVGRQVGCVDLAIAVGEDVDAPDGDPVFRIDFGNRCDRRVDLDLSALRVTADYADGIHARLTAYDPRRELRQLPLDARARGSEVIEFVAAPDHTTLPDRLCVELAGVVSGVLTDPAPACFVTDGERPVPVVGVQP